MEPVIVIGAGLAGSEAAWQLARRGVSVTLREMKPAKMISSILFVARSFESPG